MGDSGEESNVSNRKRRCRNARCNTAQLSAMVQFLSRNKDMTFGRVGGPTLAEQNAKWNEMAAKLSKLGPAKSGSQWKMVWRDVKCKTKAKYKAMHDPVRNHSKPLRLSEHEKKILLYLKYETTEQGCYMDEIKVEDNISAPPSPTPSASSDSNNVLSQIRTPKERQESNPTTIHKPSNMSSPLTAAGLRIHIDDLMKVENERTNTMKDMAEAVKRLAEAQEDANQQNEKFQQFMRRILPEILERLPAPAKDQDSNTEFGSGSGFVKKIAE